MFMASIKDVAKLAGVSPSAVSKYFKTPEHMREITKDRIKAAVNALDYYPSRIAKSLRSGSSGVIAIVLPFITNPYFADVFTHFQELCTNNGLVPVALEISSERDLRQETALLRSGLFDGALCYTTGDTEKLFSEQNADFPVVYLGPAAEPDARLYVSLDLRAGIYELCAHLSSIGVKSLGYIGNNDASSDQKLGAVKKFCTKEALTLDRAFTNRDSYSYESAYLICEGMIKSGKNLPDAFIASSDMLAVGVYKCLEEHGYNVPGDVKLSGHDDTDISKLYSPSFTTIHIPVRDLCVSAFQVLYSRMYPHQPPPDKTCYDTKLVIRETT